MVYMSSNKSLRIYETSNICFLRIIHNLAGRLKIRSKFVLSPHNVIDMFSDKGLTCRPRLISPLAVGGLKIKGL